ncbi:MAG: DUF3341 domain-containing protein [Acidobacteria bacterium]|nr:DUF3341 domain-containing protein [Acidobacteriota bacterium]
MRAIYGLYLDPDSAQRAVDQLRRAGVGDRSITVISSQPFEEYEFSHRDKPTWIFWIAAAGGVTGLTAGFLLAYMTQTLWPLVTGDMPIVAMFPNIIIMFETTMLGAILFTVVTLFVTTQLPAIQTRVYDTAVSEGKILVAVENPREDSVETLERTFRTSRGIEEVKTL